MSPKKDELAIHYVYNYVYIMYPDSLNQVTVIPKFRKKYLRINNCIQDYSSSE